MTLPPGSAYILSGVAQGRTQVCEQRKVAHNMCSCCWTHGIWNEASAHTRESITLRVFDTEWGRDIILNAVAVEPETDTSTVHEAAAADEASDEYGVRAGTAATAMVGTADASNQLLRSERRS